MAPTTTASAAAAGSGKAAKGSRSSQTPTSSTSTARNTSFKEQRGEGPSSIAGPSSNVSPAPASSSSIDPAAMTVTPYTPHVAPSFYDDLKIQLEGRQHNLGAGGVPVDSSDPTQVSWNANASSGGALNGLPFASNMTMPPQGFVDPSSIPPAMPEDSTTPTPGNNSSMVSNSRPTTAQIPTHIVKNNPFLNKLRSMVDDVKTNDLIRWTPDGDTFIVPNVARFSEEVLPRFFKHNRFSSFVRQLNMYGFHKVPHLQQGALKTDPGQDTELWEFQNDNFKRDFPELLLQMQRKKGTRSDDDKTKGRESEVADDDGSLDPVTGALTRTGRADNEMSTMHMASIWNAIQAIQQAQQGINDNLRHLHNSNAELYREAAEQRSRSKKQEETINKMLRFLAGIFGAQDAEGISGGERRSNASSSSNNDAGDRNRRVFIRPYTKGRGRLMIGDGSDNSSGVEELELPADDSDNIFEDRETTPQGRITEARSNSNSPQGGTSPTSRFRNISSPPEHRPDVISTPGGTSRRISQQAQQQIMQALSRGDAQQWLASLFGQQQQQQQGGGGGGMPQSPRMRADGNDPNSIKLDPQMLANLQSIFGGQGNFAANSNEETSNYFGPNAPQNRGAEGNAAPSWYDPSYNNPSAAVIGHDADQNRISVINRNGDHLQNVTQDANAVQQAVNQLVQGLQMTPGGTLPQMSNATPAPTNDPSATEPAQPSSDLDMDSLLKEFLHAPGTGSGSSAPTPAPNDLDDFNALIEGQTPSFAFSPGASSSNNKDRFGDFEAGPSASVYRSGTDGGSSTANTSSTATPRDSPPLTVSGSTTSRKRKPTLADDDGDIEMPHAKTKSTK